GGRYQRRPQARAPRTRRPPVAGLAADRRARRTACGHSGFGRSGVAALAGAGTSTRVQHGATPWSRPGAGPIGPGHRGRRGRGPLVDVGGLSDADLRAAAIAAPDDADDLAADLLITLPDAVVRVVGEVVELAVPLHTDLPGVLGTLAGGRAAAGIG